jgi:hypothetical protein
MSHFDDASLAAVQARHQSRLLAYPNVVAVSTGTRTKGGQPTGERCLVVYVTRKLPRSALTETQILPTQIEGVPVDVVEVGEVRPLDG